VLYIAGGLLLAILWIWAQVHYGGDSSSRPPAARPSPVGPVTVTYVVTGSQASVTYGPGGGRYTGTVPMRVTQRLASGLFYAILAFPDGRGTVMCEMLVAGKVISKSTAAGRHQLALCMISQDRATGKWTDAGAPSRS
jgi:hypothetical protein